MHKFTRSVEAANDMLEAAGVTASLIIAADGKGAAASAPADNKVTAYLIAALLEESPKEVSEAIKEYLEGDNDEL